MIIKRTLVILLSVLLVLTSFAGCQPKEQKTDKVSELYRFENYESDDVFDIEKIELSGEFAQKCMTYKFSYLSDGLMIKAYISIPLEAALSDQPAKCVLYNRGGNKNIGLLEDDTTAYICTVCDRIVVASQYRGCGGSQGVDEYGGGDVDDVIRLIDLCENEFSFVDMDDFCAMGISRGGVNTYMAARRDKRIKRIIAQSAIADMTASYESREDMRDILINAIGSTPQEDPEAYNERSAVCWADEITVPVLIIHSTGDEKVTYAQAQELYEKLKSHQNCKMITHEDDLHAFHAQDSEAIRDWLDQG